MKLNPAFEWINLEAASHVFIVWYKHGQEPIRLHELSQVFKNANWISNIERKGTSWYFYGVYIKDRVYWYLIFKIIHSNISSVPFITGDMNGLYKVYISSLRVNSPIIVVISYQFVLFIPRFVWCCTYQCTVSTCKLIIG